MNTEEYPIVREYQISGIRIKSEVLKDQFIPDHGGMRWLVIRSSCDSHRWGTRTQDYSYSCISTSPEFRDNFESARRHAAETLVKTETGEIPEGGMKFLVPEIHGPNGRKITPLSAANLSFAPTFLAQEIIDSLELVPQNNFYLGIDGGDPLPLFKAKIIFGKYQIETSIAAGNHGSPACILGGDFFQKVLNGGQDLVNELLLSDHYRTLANAARCKKRYVLIAGRYGDHRPRLEIIKKSLEVLGFVGLILDEYPDIEEQSLAEKMTTYAAISRFVIVDDFVASGHLSELEICRERKFITGVLRFQGQATTAMQADIDSEVAYIKTFEYDSFNDFQDCVLRASAWANAAVAERIKV